LHAILHDKPQLKLDESRSSRVGLKNLSDRANLNSARVSRAISWIIAASVLGIYR
jgi:hypothetical protein